MRRYSRYSRYLTALLKLEEIIKKCSLSKKAIHKVLIPDAIKVFGGSFFINTPFYANLVQVDYYSLKKYYSTLRLTSSIKCAIISVIHNFIHFLSKWLYVGKNVGFACHIHFDVKLCSNKERNCVFRCVVSATHLYIFGEK